MPGPWEQHAQNPAQDANAGPWVEYAPPAPQGGDAPPRRVQTRGPQGQLVSSSGPGQPPHPPPPEPGWQERFDRTYVAPQMAPPNEGLLHHIVRGGANFGGGVIGAVTAPIVHPLNTLQGIGGTLLDVATLGQLPEEYGGGYLKHAGESLGAGLAEHPEETIESGLGNLTGGALVGEEAKALSPVVAEAGTSIRNAAIGDTDAAALRGLRVPAGSPKSLKTISAVQASRPYLQGASSLEDLQAKLPGAKAETWGPYQKTVDEIGDTPVKGPGGEPTTIKALEAERKQLSALNRQLKTGNPEALQVAQQKGMTQAQLLDREKAVQAALDPRLQEAGIDPQAIRQQFGQLKTIEERVAGRSTLAEKPQPYGFGKMLDIDLKSPKTYIGKPMEGLRDLAAGRPLWSGKPTDIALRDAFRPGGTKPPLGEFVPGAPITSIPPAFQFDPNWKPGKTPTAFADAPVRPHYVQETKPFTADPNWKPSRKPAAFADTSTRRRINVWTGKEE